MLKANNNFDREMEINVTIVRDIVLSCLYSHKNNSKANQFSLNTS